MLISRRVTWALLIMAGLLLVPGAAFAEDKKDAKAGEGEDLNQVIVELEAAIYSKYVWRGVNTVDDWVLQANVDVQWRGFTFTGWGNIDLTDENDTRNQVSQVHATAAYGLELGPVDLEFGAIAYTFREAGNNTLELFVGAGMDVFLNPKLTLYHDVDEAEGNYLAFSMSHVFDRLFQLSEDSGLSPALTASIAYADVDYNAHYYGVRSPGFADLTAGFTVPWQLNRSFTIFASVHYSVLLDSELRNQNDKAGNLWFGIGASYEF